MTDNKSDPHRIASEATRKIADLQPVPLAYSVRGAIAASGLGRSTIFQCMADGRLQRVKIGKKTLIPRASLEALISGGAA